MAKLAEPCWSHATERETAVSDDGIWAALEPTITKDGVPPSPAILNSQGWKAVAELVGFTAGTPVELEPHLDPKNDPTDLSPVTPDIADLLVGWEKETSGKDPVGYQFDRFVYDLDRNAETRSSGELVFQSDDQGHFEYRDTSTPIAKSERKDPIGQRFTVEKGAEASWKWSPTEILSLNHSDRTYSVIPLPRELNHESQGEFRKMIREHAPFIIDVDRNATRREWELTIFKRDYSTVFVEAIPRTAARKQQFHKCLIRIDPKSFRISAIKYVDASQKLETVYIVRKRVKPLPTNEGCFPRPQSLKGYRLVLMTLGK